MQMDRELDKYYTETFNMMATEGWKYLIEDLEKLVNELSNIRTATDTQQLHFRQGQLDILDLLIKRKETCEQVYDQLTEEDKG